MAQALGGNEAEMLTASAAEGSPWLDRLSARAARSAAD